MPLRLRTFRDIVAATGLFLAASQAFLFFPGVVDSDSVSQYESFHLGPVKDWHPPAMTRLWQGLEAIGLVGSGPLFLIHLALFWSGITLLATALARRGQRLAAAGVVGVALIPPVFAWNTLVIKDTELTALLVAATGIVGWYRLGDRRVPTAAAIAAGALLAFAVLVRANAVFAVLPLAGLLATSGPRRISRGLIAITAVAMLFLLSPIINRDIFRAQEAHAGRSLQLFDIAGTAHFAHLPTIPHVAPAAWAAAEQRGCYTPYFWDKYDTDQFCPWIAKALMPRPLLRDWLTIVAAHPAAYAEHRLRHWNTTLRFLVPANMINATADESSADSRYRIGSHDSGMYWRLYQVQVAFSETPFAWPGIYLVLALAMAGVALASPPSPPRDLGLALATSSAVQLGSFAVVSLASDMRYHHWGMTSAALAATVLLGAPGVRPRRYWIGWGVTALAIAAAIVARHTLTALPWPTDAS